MRFVVFFVVAVQAILSVTCASGGQWSIPLAGNAFRVDAAAPSRDGIRRDGSVQLADAADRTAVFFRVDRPAAVQLSIRGRGVDGPGGIVVRAGEQAFPVAFESPELTTKPAGELAVAQAGYVRVELATPPQDGAGTVDVRELVVEVADKEVVVDFVKNNEGNMYYWGRRGPSCHLSYQMPTEQPLQYAYSEITVPVGLDAQGSYFMANGFAQGYFGMQVNSPTERRVLFSVWSPFSTDNPREIPEDQRIVKLAAGPGVHVGEFGNEGSGGQSYLVYPWEAGRTYRFLTEVEPDPDTPGQTRFTAWFGDKAQQDWRLIASFRRPQTTSHLRGFHAFLENFDPSTGHLTRGASYGNVWVRDTAGTWHECTTARLTDDATAQGRHRLDFDGGARGNHFFLKNCGFFAETGKVGTQSTRDSTAAEKPDVDLGSLPR